MAGPALGVVGIFAATDTKKSLNLFAKVAESMLLPVDGKILDLLRYGLNFLMVCHISFILPLQLRKVS